MKSFRFRSYSGPHFPTLELNIESYSVSLRIRSECEEMPTRTTPNTQKIYAVGVFLQKYLRLKACFCCNIVFLQDISSYMVPRSSFSEELS